MELPSHELFSRTNFLEKSSKEKTEIFIDAVTDMVKKYVFCFNLENTSVTVNDKVLTYAKTTLSLGLLYKEYSDAVRKRDGYRCWRYMLLLFRAKNMTKYAVQAACLLLQYHFIFSDRMKHQLL